ncbi:MAG: class II fructose-bisphosphate aldolase [Patescibacteria group bacterium]|nr:class II fructose-bisphosphate aldolase [Patescibacteria group bacterium]
MKSLREVLSDAKKDQHPLLHINVGSYEQLEAVARVSQKRNIPLLVGVSEGERAAWGVKRIADLVRLYRSEGISLYLNADHTHSFEAIKQAVEAGFDEVLFDAGKLSLAENITKTKEVVDWVRGYSSAHNTDILVEGELGYIGSSSVQLDTLPLDLSTHTTVEELQTFCSHTGVDLVAPAVGNIHGMLKGSSNPPLDLERIHALVSASSVPLVLHGGSGTDKKQIRDALQAGVLITHISTEVRVAWRNALEQSLTQHAGDVVPYHILPEVIDALTQTIERIVTDIID